MSLPRRTDAELGHKTQVTSTRNIIISITYITHKTGKTTYSDGKWAFGKPTVFSKYDLSTSPRTALTDKFAVEYQM